MHHCSIAIDGPAGAGKSTIAKGVARELGFTYIDTGAMYRALALYVTEKGVDRNDEEAVTASIKDADVAIRYIDDNQHVILNGRDVTSELRLPSVGETASTISTYAEVRVRLVELQRRLAENADVIMDGRDIGSVVLPNAQLKIYLTATVEERARRRCLELTERGEHHTVDEIAVQIRERDHRDMHRANSPLIRVEDAVYIDSSDMSIEEVVEMIVGLARKVER